MKTYDNIHQCYVSILKEVRDNYEYRSSPRGLPVREILDFTFRIKNPKAEAIVTRDPERNEVIARYTKDECELYDSCSNDVEDFAKASSFWRKLANPDKTVNSAYGYLIWKNKSHGNPRFETALYDENNNPMYLANVPENREELQAARRTPWEWAKESLIKDKDTRQAILRFSLPEHQWIGNKDQTCTMHGNFLIRENKLNFSVVMRSNDAVLGLAYDLPWFVSLMDRMVEELRPYYPDLEVGHYTHTVHSFHMYERDLDRVNKMIGD